MHLWDPHMPYAPPSPYDGAYYHGDPTAASHGSMADVQLDWALHDLTRARRILARHPAAFRAVKRHLHASSREARRAVLFPDAFRARAGSAAAYEELLGAVRPLSAELHRTLPYNGPLAGFLTRVRDVEYPRALYAGEISYVDHALGRLRDTLVDWGVDRRTILVVTADHGEGLGDHGVWFNHFGLWDEMIRVPLVVWAPSRVAPARRAELTSGLDVAPTLLALANVPVPPSMEGRALFADGVPATAVVSEAGRARQIAIRDGRWKLIRTLTTFYFTDRYHREAGTTELFDLESDPAERVDRAVAEPAVTTTLAQRLDAWLAAHGVVSGADAEHSAPSSTSAERLRQLRALGYVE
jgi:arylsulfatase A-like enzyme